MRKKTAEFKKLLRAWNEKLRESGFNDCERDLKSGRRILWQNASNSYRQEEQLRRENKQRYFELIGQKFHEEQFSNAIAETIMALRAEGKSISEIAESLRAWRLKPNYRQTVRWIIRYYEHKWNIRKQVTHLEKLGRKWKR